MDPAHSPSGPGRVPADAAGAGQAGLCIGGQLLHRDALHPDVGSAPIQMLAVGDEALQTKLAQYKEDLKKKIVKANEDLAKVSFKYKTN